MKISHVAICVFTLCLLSRVEAMPVLGIEASQHSDVFADERQFVRLTNLMDRIQEAALSLHARDGVLQDKGNVTVRFDPTDDSRTSVSISIGQPGIQIPVSRYLFEGDILLTPTQAEDILTQLLLTLRRQKRSSDSLLNGLERLRKRTKRKLYNNDKSRWTNFPIKYQYDYSLSTDARENIQKAITHWQDNTCLTFQEVSTASGDSMRFFRGLGCYSMIGRVGGRQGVSIGNGCERVGIVAHEIGHALGLWHEQSRPDADCCIWYNQQNIIPSTISNFLKRSWSEVKTFGIPYDLGSVMHYGPTAFTNDWSKKTIITHDPHYQRTIGQRELPSFLDFQVINKAYCEHRCKNVNFECGFGGYPHPAFCSYCLCPNGIGGYYCDRNEPPKNANCGGVIEVDGNWQEITSPDYGGKGYSIDQKCSWLIRAPKDRRVLLEFRDKFQFFCTSSCMDYVEVKTKKDFTLTGKRFCCYQAPSTPFYSDENMMVVIFRSEVSRDVGFKARVRMYPNTPVATKKPTTTTRKTTTTTTTTTTRKPTTKPSTTTTTRKPTTTTTHQPTPKPGRWGVWTSWTHCSKTCGGCGIKTRARNCLSPPCGGDTQQFRRCSFDLCPGDTTCTKINFYDEPCGSFGTQVCSKIVEVSFRCNLETCCPPFRPVRNQCRLGYADANTWDSWSEWGPCIGPKCGGCAVQARHRVCNDKTCNGPETEYQRCRTEACKDCRNESDFFPENSSCDQNQSVEECGKYKDELMLNVYTCPCCNGLRNVDGNCVP